MELTKAEWLLQLSTSWALFGLIWIVQLVHYPTFRFTEHTDFQAFHQHHTTSITYIVMPLMLVELGLALYLAYRSGGTFTWLFALVLVLLIWAHTFFLAVPLHNRLGLGFDGAVAEQLVRVNWWRTALWTLKAMWVSYVFLMK